MPDTVYTHQLEVEDCDVPYLLKSGQADSLAPEELRSLIYNIYTFSKFYRYSDCSRNYLEQFIDDGNYDLYWQKQEEAEKDCYDFSSEYSRYASTDLFQPDKDGFFNPVNLKDNTLTLVKAERNRGHLLEVAETITLNFKITKL